MNIIFCITDMHLGPSDSQVSGIMTASTLCARFWPQAGQAIPPLHLC